MFYIGETVRSRYHGFGEVTMSGDEPRVRFLDGWECRVSHDTITPVPVSVYDAEVCNRMEIERYLTLRFNGVVPSSAQFTPTPEIDLAAMMTQHAQLPPLPVAKWV